MFHINRAFRKPLKPRVQGAARREWLFPLQGLQRRNRGLSGFPQGEVGDLNANPGQAPSKCMICIGHYTKFRLLILHNISNRIIDLIDIGYQAGNDKNFIAKGWLHANQ